MRKRLRRPIAFEISEVRRRDTEKCEWEVVGHRRGEEKKREGHLTMTGLYISRENPDILSSADRP